MSLTCRVLALPTKTVYYTAISRQRFIQCAAPQPVPPRSALILLSHAVLHLASKLASFVQTSQRTFCMHTVSTPERPFTSVSTDYSERLLFFLARDYTSQQDFGTRKVYCVYNVTFHAESKYSIKIFPSPTGFVQWPF